MSDEEELLRFRLHSRCFPGVPFARHTPRVGGPTSGIAGAGAGAGGGGSGTSAVKVLALLCSSSFRAGAVEDEKATEEGRPCRSPRLAEESLARAVKRPRGDDDGSGEAEELGDTDADTATTHPQRRRRRSLYVRVQYDKALIETLPIEVMRERHPQILIDYLLSCSVWS